MSARKWATYALCGLIVHIIICILGALITSQGQMNNALFYTGITIGLCGMAVVFLQTIWVLMSVINGEFPGPRLLKIFGILVAGPFATIYIGMKYGKR